MCRSCIAHPPIGRGLCSPDRSSEAGLEADPDSENPAFFYYHALENHPERLYRFLKRWVERRHPLTLGIGLAATDGVGWPAASAMRSDPRYRDLVTSLGLPLNLAGGQP